MNMTKIEFEVATKHGIYRDALYLPVDHTYSEADIEAMQNERVQNWIAIIEAPPPPPLELIEIGGVPYERVEVDGQIILKPVQA